MKRFALSLSAVFAAFSLFAERAENVWDAYGSFGRAEGEVRRVGSSIVLETKTYRIETSTETDANGVSIRKTVLTNISARDITANCLLDRFLIEGGEYEVYSQANSWEYESRGGWQPLHTGVAVRGGQLCGSLGAAPMMAIWNTQAGRGRVFHLLTDGAWQMTALRSARHGGQTVNFVALEMGYDSRHFNYSLKPGQSLALPEIISYDFANRRDLDCHKLHQFWNRRYPAKRALPTIYNSWLCRFDKLEYDFVIRQVEKTKKIGATYFVLDAGWFGPKADWGSVRGDWEERHDGWLGGRMGDVSKAVHAAGMKFGFWLEAESAVRQSKIYREHPEYFTHFSGTPFYDFTNKTAFDALVRKINGLLVKYDADYMKFDFNQTSDFDPSGRNFIDYNKGYRSFIREIRRQRPGIYIEGCASGGLMMNLGWARDYDSFWLSDNQSPYHGMRIVRESMLRLPPRMIERWIVARTVENIQPDYGGRDSRIFATDNGTWTQIRQVSPNYLDAFTMGGPIGFSCDLTAFSDNDLAHFARVVAERRQDSEFWNHAVGRILSGTPTITQYQYDDGSLRDIRLVVVAENALQSTTTVYPVLDSVANYRVQGKVRSAVDLSEHGVIVPVRINEANFVRLIKEK